MHTEAHLEAAVVAQAQAEAVAVASTMAIVETPATKAPSEDVVGDKDGEGAHSQMVVAAVRSDRDATRRVPLTTLPQQAVAVVRVLQQSMRASMGWHWQSAM